MPKMSVSKTQEIAGPVDQVFEKVRDFHSWPHWSPWLITDPDCELDVQNDWYSWEGEICGSGRMEVVGEETNESIHYDLQFLKPWKSQADVQISFVAKGDVTEVTWTMDSSLPIFLFWMTKSMEAYIGMDYDRGLLMLKDLMETGSVPSHLEFPGREPSQRFVGVGIRRKASMDNIEQDMETHYKEVRKYYPEGQGFSAYYKWNVVKREMVYLIGVKLDKTPGVIPDGMELVNVPGMEVYAVQHRGCYRHLGNGWSAGMMHVRAKKLKHLKKFPPFELYLDENEEEPVVKICLPIK